ncbi:MAG: hypothetical protein EXS31_16215 [Pedosphaera sp.]|nr:hypothetical protein [Pedosphaera sp.]
MKTSFHPSTLRSAVAFFSAAVLCISAMAADISGTYKIKYEGQDGDSRQATVKLKSADGKLTGTVTSQTFGEAPIADAKLDGDKVTFKVQRERDGNTITFDYFATVSGDTIKGKFSGKLGDNEFSRDFEGKREASAAAGIAGNWKWSFERDGTSLNSVMKAKQEGEKFTGTVTTNDREGKIEEGKIKGGEVSFQVQRERDGNKFVVKYKGKLDGDNIVGKANVTIDGEDRSFDWNPKRAKD